ncbi:MAG: redoxin domain-containing protein [Chitinophagaceae bacterium]
MHEPFYEILKPFFSAADLKCDSSNGENKTFIFEGKILYPTAFRLFTDNIAHFNPIVFVNAGNNEINIENKNGIYTIKSTSSIEIEQQHFLKEMDMQNIDDKLDPVKLLAFIQKDPGSSVAFFALLNQLMQFETFYASYYKILDAFSDNIKNTQRYKYFKSIYTPNKKIDNYIVYKNRTDPMLLNFSNDNNKYTLLEFYFTGCSGCVEQMNYMKDSTPADIAKKLNIVIISTDKKSIFEKSKAWYQEKQYPWKRYWDWESANIDQITINWDSFPNNLFIDANGRIIAKNADFKTISDFFK